MKVTRYINGELLVEKEMPKITIENPAVIAMIKEIEFKAMKERKK